MGGGVGQIIDTFAGGVANVVNVATMAGWDNLSRRIGKAVV